MTAYLGRTVQREYSNSTTMLQLLSSFDQWVDLTQFTADFLTHVWNIDTATGFGLDIWGRILGQSRYIQVAQIPGKNFGFNINPAGVPVNAINQEFAIGDGITSTFQLSGPSHSPANNAVVVSSIYRNDWQGNQLLYATARTNLLFRSSSIGGTGWTNASCTATLNAGTGPDGANSATLLTANSSTFGSSRSTAAVATSTVYTASVWFRKNTSSQIAVRIFDGTVTTQIANVIINLSAGGAPSLSSSLNVIGTPQFVADQQGGYRVSFSFNSGSFTSVVALHYPDFSAGTRSTYFTYPQVEIGSQATPFIPTTAAAVTVTDYSATSGGVVALGQLPVAGAVLSWNGSYIGSASGTQWKPWNQAPFFGGQAAGTVAIALADPYYRKLLLVKAASNIATSDCPSINALMRAMFGDRGRCYVGYDSNVPMHIGYHFEFTPTPVEQSIIQSGIFPQPAGTIAQYIYGAPPVGGFFGFAGGNTGANPAFVAPWSHPGSPWYQPGAPTGNMLDNIGDTFMLDQSQMG